jgi:HAE1 family hydrophobic/amphiphilic exporter-1
VRRSTGGPPDVHHDADTVVGVLPLVASTGADSELYRGLGSAVLGGLTLSTIVPLLLVPVVYSLGLDAQRALSSPLPAWWRGAPTLEVSEKRGGA